MKARGYSVRRYPQLVAWAAALLLAAGCGRGGERGQEPKDYRKMLERVRDRNAANQSLAEVRKGLEKFQVDLGRLPTNLFELVRTGYLKEIPPPPEGYGYQYDDRYGRVGLARRPDAAGGGAETPPPPVR